MTAGAIFSAIAGLIQAIPIVDGWLRQLIAAWMDLQTKETISGIVNAGAIAVHSKTADDRYQASIEWQRAFKRPRNTG